MFPTPKPVPLGIPRKDLFSTEYITHAMKQQFPEIFNSLILNKLTFFSLETYDSSTSTKSMVFPFLMTKNDSQGINKLTVPGPREKHICSIFYLVCFVFVCSSGDLPVPRNSTNANRFYSRVLRVFPPSSSIWCCHALKNPARLQRQSPCRHCSDRTSGFLSWQKSQIPSVSYRSSAGSDKPSQHPSLGCSSPTASMSI